MATIHKLILIYRITVSTIRAESSGDFYDIASNDASADEFFFGIDANMNPLIVYNERIGTLHFSNCELEAVLKDISSVECTHLPMKILQPMLNSAYVRDKSVLADAFNASEFAFYEADPSEDVDLYKSNINEAFSVFSITETVNATCITVDSVSDRIFLSGQECENLGWAFAEIAESSSWAMVVRPMTTADSNVVLITAKRKRMS